MGINQSNLDGFMLNFKKNTHVLRITSHKCADLHNAIFQEIGVPVISAKILPDASNH